MYQSPYNPLDRGPARRFWQDWSPATWIIVFCVVGLAGWWLYTEFGLGTPRIPWQTLVPRLIVPVVIILAAMPVHEFAHAAMAVWLGDETPRRQGRLTLNPLRHLDPVGSILLLTLGMGWAKPVQWNPANIRTNIRTGTILVAGAGPLSNILLAFLAILVVESGTLGRMDFGAWRSLVYLGVQAFIQINLLLAVFNLIPVPPLDGSHILFSLLPPQFTQLRIMLSQYGIIVILLIVWFLPGLIRGVSGSLEVLLYTLARAVP